MPVGVQTCFGMLMLVFMLHVHGIVVKVTMPVVRFFQHELDGKNHQNSKSDVFEDWTGEIHE